MPNMSYCRFHNTLLDLQDCYEALCNEETLSEAEEKCKKKLLDLCLTIAEDFGNMNEDNDD